MSGSDSDREVLEAARKRASSRGEGCGWRARRHQYSYDKWDRRATRLKLLAGAASVLAGAALFSEPAKSRPWLSYILGGLAIAAGLLQIVDQSFTPRGKADQHRTAWADYQVMRSRYYQFASLQRDPETAEARFRELEELQFELDGKSIPPETWTQPIIDELYKKRHGHLPTVS